MKYFQKYRSSRSEVSYKKGVLRILAEFTGKHLCQSFFFNKVAGFSFLIKLQAKAVISFQVIAIHTESLIHMHVNVKN